MQLTPKTALTIILAAATSAVADLSQQMRAGLWETTLYAASADGQQQPVSSTNTCYSREEIAAANAAIPKNDKCTVTDYSISGQRVKWEIACPAGVSGSGTISFSSSEAYDGQLLLIVRSPGNPERTLTNRFSGRWLGDCNK